MLGRIFPDHAALRSGSAMMWTRIAALPEAAPRFLGYAAGGSRALTPRLRHPACGRRADEIETSDHLLAVLCPNMKRCTREVAWSAPLIFGAELSGIHPAGVLR